MHRAAIKWRLLVPAVALIAVAGFFLGGRLTEQDTASAGILESSANVSCFELILGELTNPVGTGNPAKPWNMEEAIPRDAHDDVFGLIPGGFVAKGLTYGVYYDNGDSDSAGVTLNFGLPGIISGSLATFEPCATVEKIVADVSSNPSDPRPGPTQINVTETPGNAPLVGMLVYWNSSNSNQDGFWVVTAADGQGSVTLRATDAACNGADSLPSASAPGDLYSCIPVNKAVDVLAYSNPPVGEGKGGYLDGPTTKPRAQPSATEDCTGPFSHVPYGPGGVPITSCGVGYDDVNSVGYSVTCAPTASLENPPASSWTRTEVYTKSSDAASRKVPSYGVVQLYNPVAPNTCANTAETKRSTNGLVAWGLDSSEIEGERVNWDSDYDKDGCLDWQELGFPQPASPQGVQGEYKGGRDPTNPYDCDRNLSGIWNIEVTAIEAVLETPAKTITPGGYFRCRADFDHNKGTNALDAAVFCYIDNPLIPVNPQAGPETGDGLPGESYPIGDAGPPEPYADVDDVQTHLSGAYTPSTDTMAVSGCFEDRDGESPLGHVYVEASAVVLSGHGSVDIWVGQTQEDCLAGTPVGLPTFADANLQIGIQAGKIGTDESAIASYDFDLDRCPDRNELSNNQQQGGLRDPYNRWDYMNPTMDGQNRVDDILATVNQYFIDAGNPEYTTETDRTAVIGANPWNLGPPNGQQRVDDILASVKSYFHDCSVP